jgi:NADH:ubiquinone oxidoreductase subunit F (NADH-binding)
MTATLPTRPVSAPPMTAIWTIGTPRLFAGLESRPTLDYAAHQQTHGVLPGVDLPRLLDLLGGPGIAGRGGAGFPLADKVRALPPGPRRVVVNGSESEPASHKDRTLLRRAPHLVLDGALLLAQAIGARSVTVAVHDVDAANVVRAAVRDRRDARRVDVRRVPGGFVAGEARALLRSLAGGPAVPPGRRNHATDDGVLVANVETLAQLALLARLGRRRFAETGTAAEPGTTLVTVGGAVGRPGVVEIPIGTPLSILLGAAHATPAQAVVIGGFHGSWHPPHADLPLSRAGVAAAGGSFGAGIVYVLDERTCALGELSAVAGWLAGESARQCGPCLFGLPALAADVAALCRGDGRALAVAARHAAAVDGRGACSHPDGTARFVRSGITALSDEVRRHLAHGGCGRPVLGQLPTTGGRR